MKKLHCILKQTVQKGWNAFQTHGNERQFLDFLLILFKKTYFVTFYMRERNVSDRILEERWNLPRQAKYSPGNIAAIEVLNKVEICWKFEIGWAAQDPVHLWRCLNVSENSFFLSFTG